MSVKNTSNNVASFFTFIGKNPMTVVYVAGAILGSWIIYRLYKDNPIVRGWEKAKQREEEEKEDRRIASRGATITRARAQAIASQLYGAMDGMGTDFPRIKSLLAPLSEADYQLVAQIFGTRGSSYSFGLQSQNLDEWLVNDLSSSEFQELKRINPRLPI